MVSKTAQLKKRQQKRRIMVRQKTVRKHLTNFSHIWSAQIVLFNEMLLIYFKCVYKLSEISVENYGIFVGSNFKSKDFSKMRNRMRLPKLQERTENLRTVIKTNISYNLSGCSPVITSFPNICDVGTNVRLGDKSRL